VIEERIEVPDMIGKPILDVGFSRLAEPNEIRCDAMRPPAQPAEGYFAICTTMPAVRAHTFLAGAATIARIENRHDQKRAVISGVLGFSPWP
jgi:hypothetical protein